MIKMKRQWVVITVLMIVVLSGWFFYRQVLITPVIHVAAVRFSDLPGWRQADDLRSSLAAFKRSCDQFMQQSPQEQVGADLFPLTAADWRPICQAADALKTPTNRGVQQFFESYFQVYTIGLSTRKTGRFTAYYLPVIPARLQRQDGFSVPIYGRPRDMVSFNLHDFSPELPNRILNARIVDGRVQPMKVTRAQINAGALTGRAPVLAWTTTRFNRLRLQTQGSGALQFPGQQKKWIGYAGQTGLPDTMLGASMLRAGYLTRQTMSMPAIERWVMLNRQAARQLMEENQSFVFFKWLPEGGIYGAQKALLTPGYSLAVDPRFASLGAPIWLSLGHAPSTSKLFNKRLMIAQDTGGAIKGVVRGDVYLGDLPGAKAIAGNTNDIGRWWLLLPKGSVIDQKRIKQLEKNLK